MYIGGRMSLIKEYFELTEKYQNEYGEKTIVFMQVGKFFECYGYRDRDRERSSGDSLSGSRIEECTRVCELKIANKNICVGEKDVVMAGFTLPFLEKYLKYLQEAGFTTVVYTQDEQCPDTTRSLAGIYSPGTYFASDDASVLSNHISCVWIHSLDNKFSLPTLPKGQYIYVGISDVDIVTGKTTVFQYMEPWVPNSPTPYDELERFLSIHNPNEVICISNMPEAALDSILSYVNVRSAMIHKIVLSALTPKPTPMTERALRCEKQTYQKQVLDRFFGENVLDECIEHVFACQSFCFLLDFIYQHNPYLVRRLIPPMIENHSHRLILANHSLQQLNMIGTDKSRPGSKSCIEALLNRCVTPMGRRQFTYALLNPTTDVVFLNREYDATSLLLGVNRDGIRGMLASLRDLSKWNRQMFLNRMPPRHFFSLFQNVETIQWIWEDVYKVSGLFAYLLERNRDFARVVDCCAVWKTAIQTHLDLDKIKEMDMGSSGFEVNFMKPGLDPELDEKVTLYETSVAQLEEIRQYFNTILSKCDGKGTGDYVKLHETEKNCVRLVATKRRCALLKKNLSPEENVTFEMQGASNQSIQTPHIHELCKNIYLIKSDIKNMVERAYHQFVKGLEAWQTEWLILVDFVTVVDMIYTKAHVASLWHYCRPTLVGGDKAEGAFVKATGLRHALIEQIQEDELYVANQVEVGTERTRGVLLYGTNAVGKTSYIKSIGVAIIMAQVGLFVPATSFVYKPYKRLFTRILGNDNVFKGLSTFAVEMSELRVILNQAGSESLVLGDEVCSGTESVSAMSIFVAAVQRLHEARASFLFATHMHEIAQYSEITELTHLRIQHMAVMYDREKDRLIYNRELQEGAGDSMYGLEVCKSLHLPRDFLEQANHLRMKYFPEARNILSLKPSHFNAKKIVGFCEACGNSMASEVHHLQHQREALPDGFIEAEGGSAPFHKNHAANLIALCERCHQLMHREKTQYKKIKTDRGYILGAI